LWNSTVNFGATLQIKGLTSPTISGLPTKIPYAAEQGNSTREQGNVDEEQGIPAALATERCGICVESCPTDVLRMDADGTAFARYAVPFVTRPRLQIRSSRARFHSQGLRSVARDETYQLGRFLSRMSTVSS
jgi:ferredoxin